MVFTLATLMAVVTPLGGLVPARASTSAVWVSNISVPDYSRAGWSRAPYGLPHVLFAGKFTTGPANYRLDGATARLWNHGPYGLATYEARIYADGGSVPGALLMTFDNSPTNPGGSQSVDFVTGSGMELAASTSYWLAVRNTTGSSIGWSTTNRNDETSPGGWTIADDEMARTTNAAASWTNISCCRPYQSQVPRFSITASLADATPPVVITPEDVVVEATGPDGADVVYSGESATDETDGPVPVVCSPASGTTFPIGTTDVLCSATDAAGNVGGATFAVTVQDKTPPEVACQATPSMLWPPNHKMKDAEAVVTVSDGGSGPAGFTLASVESNEPDNGADDGDTTGDIEGWTFGADDLDGSLRAERSGTGTGRVYTLTYTGADVAGNTAMCSTTVAVPLSAG